MTDPIETLDAGGAGLGRDVDDQDTREHRVQQAFIGVLKDNHRLRMSRIELEQEIADLGRTVQWRTLFIFVGFALGFLLCALLMAVAK